MHKPMRFRDVRESTDEVLSKKSVICTAFEIKMIPNARVTCPIMWIGALSGLHSLLTCPSRCECTFAGVPVNGLGS